MPWSELPGLSPSVGDPPQLALQRPDLLFLFGLLRRFLGPWALAEATSSPPCEPAPYAVGRGVRQREPQGLPGHWLGDSVPVDLVLRGLETGGIRPVTT